MENKKVFAPFTLEQVVYLEIWQNVLPVKPFQCPNGEEDKVEDRRLIPTEEGWTCPRCGYTQNWCHAFMCEKPEWHPIENELFYELGKATMENLRLLYADDLVESLKTLRMEGNERLKVFMTTVRELKQILDHYEQNRPYQEAL